MEIERSENILNLQLEWVKTADSKVAPLFAINIAMLGLLAALVKLLPSWTIATAIFSSITVLLLAMSMLFLALTMFPRLIGPKESNVFFGGITKQSEEKYILNMPSISDTEYQKDILSQVYRNAEIASSKYANLKLAFIFTFASAIPWLVAVYILYV
ncbi:MAG: Pycsar system effector family protein [Candidatus Thiodiazotropha endolucinida]